MLWATRGAYLLLCVAHAVGTAAATAGTHTDGDADGARGSATQGSSDLLRTLFPRVSAPRLRDVAVKHARPPRTSGSPLGTRATLRRPRPPRQPPREVRTDSPYFPCEMRRKLLNRVLLHTARTDAARCGCGAVGIGFRAPLKARSSRSRQVRASASGSCGGCRDICRFVPAAVRGRLSPAIPGAPTGSRCCSAMARGDGVRGSLSERASASEALILTQSLRQPAPARCRLARCHPSLAGRREMIARLPLGCNAAPSRSAPCALLERHEVVLCQYGA
jgi:hypothetical protein